MKFINATEARRIKFLQSCDESQRYNFDRGYDELERLVDSMINGILYKKVTQSVAYIILPIDVGNQVLQSMFFKLNGLGWSFKWCDLFHCPSQEQSDILKSMDNNKNERSYCLELWLKKN